MAINERFPLAIPEGTVLAGQYVITKVLGQGGFGITYQAKDHKTGQKYAIKEFFPDSMATRMQGTNTVMPFTGDRGENFLYGKECFLQEAETLAQFIGNDGIVRIYSYFEEYGTAYFVMDFIEGKSLDAYIKEKGGKLPFEETLKLLIPVMDALESVHQKGIVHRDVAPDNIYLTNDGAVKLIDFGAARQSLGDKSQSLDVVLKHGFAPKEQYTRRGRQGPYTDIYALGATFYFALTGKRPPDSLERLEEDDIVLPSTLGVSVPKQAEEAIMTALNVRSEDRFQRMGAFKTALVDTGPADRETRAVRPQQSLAGEAVHQRFFTAPDNTEATGKTGRTDTTAGNTFGQVKAAQHQNGPRQFVKGKTKLLAGIFALIGLIVLITVISVSSGSSVSEEPATKPGETTETASAEETVPDENTYGSDTEEINTTPEEGAIPAPPSIPAATPDEMPADDGETADEEPVVDEEGIYFNDIPWGTSAEDIVNRLGDGYKLNTYEDCRSVNNINTEGSYNGVGSWVNIIYYCDYRDENNKLWEGLYYDTIIISDTNGFSEDDINRIIEQINEEAGQKPEIERSDYIRWRKGDTVVVMMPGSLQMSISYYDADFFDRE